MAACEIDVLTCSIEEMTLSRRPACAANKAGLKPTYQAGAAARSFLRTSGRERRIFSVPEQNAEDEIEFPSL
jgi:hypothetical protein